MIAMGFRLPYDTFCHYVYSFSCYYSCYYCCWGNTRGRSPRSGCRMEAGRHEAGAGHDRESNMKYARDQA